MIKFHNEGNMAAASDLVTASICFWNLAKFPSFIITKNEIPVYVIVVKVDKIAKFFPMHS